MKRREWLFGLAGLATVPLVGTIAARAQQPDRTWRLAIAHQFMWAGALNALANRGSMGVFFDELCGQGYVEGTNLVVERFSGIEASPGQQQIDLWLAATAPALIISDITKDYPPFAFHQPRLRQAR